MISPGSSGQSSTSARGNGSSGSHCSTRMRRVPTAPIAHRPSSNRLASTMRATVPTPVRASPPPTSLPRSMSTTPNSGSPARQWATSAW